MTAGSAFAAAVLAVMLYGTYLRRFNALNDYEDPGRLEELRACDCCYSPEQRVRAADYRAEALLPQRLRYFIYRSRMIWAVKTVRHAIVRGILVRPGTCSRCDRACKPVAHHWSYEIEHWLDVVWLCRKCHSKVHKEVVGLNRNWEPCWEKGQVYRKW